jgi:hypothetical protein
LLSAEGTGIIRCSARASDFRLVFLSRLHSRRHGVHSHAGTEANCEQSAPTVHCSSWTKANATNGTVSPVAECPLHPTNCIIDSVAMVTAVAAAAAAAAGVDARQHGLQVCPSIATI